MRSVDLTLFLNQLVQGMVQNHPLEAWLNGDMEKLDQMTAGHTKEFEAWLIHLLQQHTYHRANA